MGGVTWRIIPAVDPQAEGVHRAHDDEGAICVAVCYLHSLRENILRGISSQVLFVAEGEEILLCQRKQ